MISEVIKKLQDSREERFSRESVVLVNLDEEIAELRGVELHPVKMTMENFAKARENGFRVTESGEKEKTDDMFKVCMVAQGFKEFGWAALDTLKQEPAGVIEKLFGAVIEYSGFNSDVVGVIQKKKKS